MDGTCDSATVCEQAADSKPPSESSDAAVGALSSDASMLASVATDAVAAVSAECVDASVPAVEIVSPLHCEAPDAAMPPESSLPCESTDVTKPNEDTQDPPTQPPLPEVEPTLAAAAVSDGSISDVHESDLDQQSADIFPADCDKKVADPWYASIQGPWETSRLGFITVVGERIVQRVSGAQFALYSAPDGRFALSNWRADAPVKGRRLEWTQVDNPASGDVVLWDRPDSYDEKLFEQPKHAFDTLQGRWEATRLGGLRVNKGAVRYDSWDPSRPPLRLAMDPDGRVALLNWKAEVQPSADVVRWTIDGDATQASIIWTRKQEVRAASSGPKATAKQRAVKPRTSTRQQEPSKSANRKEMQRLKKSVNQYQSEFEKLKLKIEKKERREREKENTPKMSKKKRDKEDPTPIPHVPKKPRAKATARKYLMEAKAKLAGGSDDSGSDSDDSMHQPLFGDEQRELQAKIDKLDDYHFDKMMLFLEPELGKPKGDVIRLDVRTLIPERQHALVAMVTSELDNLNSIQVESGAFNSIQMESGGEDSSSGSSSSSSSDSDSTPHGNTQ